MRKDVIVKGAWEWQGIYSMVPHGILNEICSSPPPQLHPAAADFWIWKHSNSGCYSVSSAYRFLSSMDRDNSQWKWMWKAGRQPYQKNLVFFLWLLSHKALPVNALRFHRHLATSPLCLMCGTEIETWAHCLFYCDWARLIWRDLKISIPIDCDSIPKENIRGFLQAMTRLYGTPFMAALWTLWLERNGRIFRGKQRTGWTLRRDIWRMAADLTTEGSTLSSGPGTTRWISWNENNATGFILHIDGIRMGNEGRTAYGFVVRNGEGEWLEGEVVILANKLSFTLNWRPLLQDSIL